jgi:hypothetical protein
MCFYLRVGHEFWGEAMIAKRLFKIPKLVRSGKRMRSGKIDLLTTEGAVSIRYDDEELLGIEFWDIITNVHPIPNELLAGRPQHISLPDQGLGITLTPQGDELRYHAKSFTPKRVWEIDRVLPLGLFVQEWTVMYFRFSRLLASLGSVRAKRVIGEWEEYMSPQWRTLMGDDRLRYLSQADLAELLSDSNCTGGYVYSESKGFEHIV